MGSDSHGVGPREPRAPWRGRKVVLGVCGGIAAYKVIQVARDLTLLGATVDVVLTKAAQEFVTPLSFEGVTGRTPVTGLFTAEGAALHVVLGREADVICVAPATADFLSRAASGRADDLLTTVLLATEAPVVLAPSMNDRMFAHPQTQTNLAHLEGELGYQIVGPVAGKLAVGEGRGPGRLVDPETIVEAVGRALEDGSVLSGRKVVITAGPTREPLDAVRYVGNRSSGKMGHAIARAAWRRGADVTLVCGPGSPDAPFGVNTVSVETAVEMRDAVLAEIPSADVAIYAAAVSDFRPEEAHAAKLKREQIGERMDLAMVANPDVALTATSRMKPGSLAVGFALETDDLEHHAKSKLERKGFHFIVANRADLPGSGFETDTNQVLILSDLGERTELPLMSKADVASRLLDLIEGRMKATAAS